MFNYFNKKLSLLPHRLKNNYLVFQNENNNNNNNGGNKYGKLVTVKVILRNHVW